MVLKNEKPKASKIGSKDSVPKNTITGAFEINKNKKELQQARVVDIVSKIKLDKELAGEINKHLAKDEQIKVPRPVMDKQLRTTDKLDSTGLFYTHLGTFEQILKTSRYDMKILYRLNGNRRFMNVLYHTPGNADDDKKIGQLREMIRKEADIYLVVAKSTKIAGLRSQVTDIK